MRSGVNVEIRNTLTRVLQEIETIDLQLRSLKSAQTNTLGEMLKTQKAILELERKKTALCRARFFAQDELEALDNEAMDQLN
jgi:predicted enzyme involved in methoxymalonyl-ACP biosynthesis